MTYILIVVTAFISYKAFNDRALFDRLKYHKGAVIEGKQYHRLLTSAFLHADWNHLIFNMLTLYFFGDAVEFMFDNLFIFKFGRPAGLILSKLLFVFFYLSASIMSSLPSLFIKRHPYHYSAIGASGATSAVLFASILFYPLSTINFFIPAYIFGFIYLGVSAYMAKRNVDNIGHDAHFWGAVYGFIFPILFDPSFFMRFLNELGL